MDENQERCASCGEPGTVENPLQPSGATGLQTHAACEEKERKLFGEWVNRNREKLEAQNGLSELGFEIAQNLAKRTGYIAAANAFIDRQPLYYDKNALWWLYNQTTRTWRQSDEVEILNLVRRVLKLFGDPTVKSSSDLIKALQQVGREREPKMLSLNQIQFRDQLYDLSTGRTEPSGPQWFSTNTIPWRLADSEEMPVLERLFTEWVGTDYVETLYEILAYCCYRDYPIHIISAFTGSGRNGKTSFLRILRRFVGDDNIVSTDLDRLITNRFETFNLYRRLVATMGETDFSILQSTSLIKRLVGQDLIPFEKKGKDEFSDVSYAKILIATNSLPSSDDTSEGYYRRWLIIDFPHEFPEGADIVLTIPDAEYEALARKVTRILPSLLARGQFSRQGSIEERRRRYINASNPLIQFIDEHCDRKDENACIRFSLLFMRYAQWLGERKKRIVKKKEFSAVLENEGFEIRKTTLAKDGGFENGVFVFGLRFSDDGFEFGHAKPSVTIMRDMPIFPLRLSIDTTESNYKHNAHNAHTDAIKPEFSFPTLYDVVGVLKQLQESEGGALIPFETLLQAFPGEEKILTQRLRDAAERGSAYEPKPGFWGVLE